MIGMSRAPRLVIPGIPHHVTQRGNRRGDLFFCDEDRLVFLEMLFEACVKSALALIAYCLMSNHIHLEAVPSTKKSLSDALHRLFTRYAHYINRARGWQGHLVQNRFFSSPLDDEHSWLTCRYIENNPVRAGLAPQPADYRWSSAYLRSRNIADPLIDSGNLWYSKVVKGQETLSPAEMQRFSESLHRAHARNFPIGSEAFLSKLEEEYQRDFKLRGRGRPKRISRAEESQIRSLLAAA